MLLFIYILHSLNLTKGLDNTMLVPYRRKYSSGTLFLCVLLSKSKMQKKMQGNNLCECQATFVTHGDSKLLKLLRNNAEPVSDLKGKNSCQIALVKELCKST